ncbi:MAG: S-layer homology domain-containing protein [Candidatus Peregrinibacteria bacterium]|nr:S-layer homology domain-containing protein [Candidatus Peregrinibacteria bacterium]MDZ4245352.1 S-layer homology domain-containing protein [Candidatus Gracilibacteria bacterium]
MRKKLLVAMLVGALSIGTFAVHAFASNSYSYFGHITNFVDEGDTGEFYIMLEQCDGDTHKFEFLNSSDRATWRTSVNRYMTNNDLVNIGDEGNFFVEVMANVAGGTCDNLQLILDALAANDDSNDDGDDTGDGEDSHVDDSIMEVYMNADDLPEGEVLSRPPSDFEDDVTPTLYDSDGDHREVRHDFKKRIMPMLINSNHDEADDNLRGLLKRELAEKLKEEGPVSPSDMEALKNDLRKRALLHKSDDDVEELERRVGFTHVNPVKIDKQSDATLNGKVVTLRGIFKSKDGYNILVNQHGEMFVKLDLQDKDYSKFIDQKVFVKGTGYRAEKSMIVDNMRALNKNESDGNNAQMQFRIGASLYEDIDTNDDGLWYTKYLSGLFDRGVFTGYADGTFGGANPVTIAETAKVVSESAEHEVDSDVSENQLRAKYKKHWAKFYLKHAEDFNLLPAVDNPDRPALRAEVIEAILRAYGVDPTAEAGLPDAFPDTKDKFIRKAFKLGIVKGFDDGTFRPNAETNRAEVAKMMTIAAELLGESALEEEVVDDIFGEIEDLDTNELEGWIDETQ